MRRDNRIRLARAALRNLGADLSRWSEERLHQEYHSLMSKVCVGTDDKTGEEIKVSALKFLLRYRRPSELN